MLRPGNNANLIFLINLYFTYLLISYFPFWKLTNRSRFINKHFQIKNVDWKKKFAVWPGLHSVFVLVVSLIFKCYIRSLINCYHTFNLLFSLEFWQQFCFNMRLSVSSFGYYGPQCWKSANYYVSLSDSIGKAPGDSPFRSDYETSLNSIKGQCKWLVWSTSHTWS